jgi:hypothetical protein
MSQIVKIEVYTFSELSDTAKEKAREWYREGMEFSWCDESRDSIQQFCDQYGAKLTRWNVGAFSPIDYRLDAPPALFRGLKLSELDRDAMPTGYWLDSVLHETFFDEWKRTSDACAAFDSAIHAAFDEWRRDMEWQLSDEAIDEALTINEYTFTENGKFFPV